MRDRLLRVSICRRTPAHGQL